MNLFGKNDTTDLRDKLAAHRRDISDALTRLRERIATLESERTHITRSSITREDYTRLVLEGIDRRADEEVATLARHFQRCAAGENDAGRSRATVSAAIRATQPDDAPRYMHRAAPIYGLPLNIGGREGDALGALPYAFFRDAIKRTASEAITCIDPWPADAASLDIAAARLEEIGRELAELRSQEETAAAEAREFGAAT